MDSDFRQSRRSILEFEKMRFELVNSLQDRPDSISTQLQFFDFFAGLGRHSDQIRMKSYLLEFHGWLPFLCSRWINACWPPEKFEQLAILLQDFAPYVDAEVMPAVMQQVRTAASLAWFYLGEPEKASAALGLSAGGCDSRQREKSRAAAWLKSTDLSGHPILAHRLRKWTDENDLFLPGTVQLLLLESPRSHIESVFAGVMLPLTGTLRERAADAEEDRVLFTNHTDVREQAMDWAVMDGMAAARMLLPFSSATKPYYSLHLSLPQKEAHYFGSSMGLASGILSYALMVNRHYRSPLVRISTEVALTGGLRADGVVTPIDSESLQAKMHTAFFSPLQRVFIPSDNHAEAAQVIDQLKTRYPHRHLSLEGIENLAQAVEDRNLLQHRRVTPGLRTVAAFRRTPAAYLAWLLPVILSLALAILALMGVFGPVRLSEPANFQVEGNELRIFDAENNLLWTHDFQIPLEKKHYDPAWAHNIVIQDINHDGHKEVLFGSYEINDARFSGIVWLFDDKGQMVWQRPIGHDVSFGGQYYTDHFRIHYLAAHDINGDGENEIFISAWHYPDWPNLFQVLDLQGKVLGEYWNAGYCNIVEFHDVNYDGKDDILLGGQNNEYKSAVLVVLAGDSMRGCSPQTPGSKFYPDGLSAGSQSYYLRFPHTEFVQLGQRDQVGWIDKGRDLTVVVTNAYPQLHWGLNVTINPGMVYYSLGEEMKLLQPPIFGDIYKALLKGHLGIDLETGDQSRYQQIVYWRDGGWTR